VVTGNIAEAELAVLLHLPPPRDLPEAEPPTAGRQGGPALAVIGMLFALLGVVLWLLRSDAALASTGIAVAGVGVAEMIAGLALTLHRR